MKTKLEEILEELDKGEYNNFADNKLLCEELMKDFKVSHTLAMYVAIMFIHNNSKTCENCKWFIDESVIAIAKCMSREDTLLWVSKKRYCDKWEQKERPRIMGEGE